MDTDGSLTVTLLEFEKFLKPLEPAPRKEEILGVQERVKKAIENLKKARDKKK